MSEKDYPSQEGDAKQESSKKSEPDASTKAKRAKQSFEAELAKIAGLAEKVNDERLRFLANNPTKPNNPTKELRDLEKELFKAIMDASKPKGPGDFETLTVELSYKPWPKNNPETDVISAVRGLTFYHQDNENFALAGEQDGDSDGVPIVPKYSSLSSSSSVNRYA